MNREAARLLRKHNIAVMAGCIVGYPDDTKQSVVKQFQAIKQLKPDSIYAQYLTPYPKTQIREELLKEDLIANANDFSKYDGFTCNIRTRHLTQDQLYRTLKREGARAYLAPSLIFGNIFLKNHLKNFIIMALKGFRDNIYNTLFGRQRSSNLDL